MPRRPGPQWVGYLIVLIGGLSVMMYVTRVLGSDSLWSWVLPFGFPVILAVIGALILKTGAGSVRGLKPDLDTVTLSGRPEETIRLGPRSVQPSTVVALTMFTPLFTKVLPSDGGFSGQARLLFYAWWILWIAIVGLVLPRIIKPRV